MHCNEWRSHRTFLIQRQINRYRAINCRDYPAPGRAAYLFDNEHKGPCRRFAKDFRGKSLGGLRHRPCRQNALSEPCQSPLHAARRLHFGAALTAKQAEGLRIALANFLAPISLWGDAAQRIDKIE